MTDGEAGEEPGDAPDNPRLPALRAWIEPGAQVVGGLAGAAIGLVNPLLGGAAGGAISAALAKAGLEFHDRMLAPRQGARAAGAYASALVRADERLRAGDLPRDDWALDVDGDGRADAEELAEGTLLAAANAYQERKVALLGRFYANLAFEREVSAEEANHLLGVIGRLTYRQLQVLGFLGLAQQTGSRYETELVNLVPRLLGGGQSSNQSLLAEVRELMEVFVLIGTGPPGRVEQTEGWNPSVLPDIKLMPVGETLFRLLQLGEFPEAELDAVLAAFAGE